MKKDPIKEHFSKMGKKSWAKRKKDILARQKFENKRERQKEFIKDNIKK